MITGRVLLLNFSYEPLGTIGVARAICMWFSGKLTIEENDGENFLHSPSTTIPVPSVVRLRSYVHVKRRRQETTMKRARIYIRDRYRCQYCGEHYPAPELTFDHVIPRSRGGHTLWTNVVTACSSCNLEKGNRTPREAGMYPQHEPYQPTSWQLQENGRAFPPNYLHQSWRDFLYWDSELDPE